MNRESGSSLRIQRRLHALLTGLWIRRRLILIPTLVLPVVGFIIGLTGTKTYLTHTSVLIQEPALFNPFLEDLAISTNLEDRMPGIDALLHSRHVLSEVGISLGLLEKNPSAEAIDNFVDEIGHKMSMHLFGTDLIRIEYRDTEPSTMAQTLETVTTFLIEQIVAPEQSSLTGSEAFLRQQLDDRHSELLRAETTLAAFKSKNSQKLPRLHESNLIEADRLKRMITEKETELAGARAQLSASRQKLTQTNPLLGQLEKVIIEVRSDLASARASYTDQHSQVRALQRRLDHLDAERRRILAETKPLTSAELDRLWNMLSSPETDNNPGQQSLLYLQLESLHLATQKEQSLIQELQTLRGSLQEVAERVSSYGDVEMQLNELQRDLDVKESIYKDLLERWELAQVTRALGDYESGERIKVIDRPYTPSSPVNPPLLIYVLAGLVGGLMAGLGVAFVFELIDTRVKRRDQVVTLTGLPVLARLPPLS